MDNAGIIYRPQLWLPRYGSPKNPQGIIPPSPPKEYRHRQAKAILRDVRSFTGRLPAYLSKVQGLINGGLVNQGHAMVDAGIIRAGVTNPLASLTDASFYYKLEDVNDSTANANNLTNTGTVTFSTGKVGNAAYTTTAKYLSHDYAAALDLSGGAMQVSCWFYITTAASFMWALGFDQANDTNHESYYLQYRNSDTSMMFGFLPGSGSSGNVVATTFGAISTATWYFCTFKADGLASGGKAYISINNGTFDTAVCLSGVASVASAKFLVGARYVNPTFDSYWQGRVDEVGGWKRNLTSGEVSLLYNSGNGATVFP